MSLTEENPSASDPNADPDYWKLQDPCSMCICTITDLLKRKGFYYPKSASDTRIRTLFLRAERGFHSYDNCKVTELRQFIRDRRLDVKLKTMKKAKMITVLEEADEAIIFHRFLELPAELRKHIYSFYIINLEALDSPAPPPITAVSRLVRNETLPLFYEVCRFYFELNVLARERDERSGQLLYKVYPSETASKFLTLAPTIHLETIQRLRIHATMCCNIAPMGQGIWDIDLDTKDRGHQIQQQFFHTVFWKSEGKMKEEIEAKLRVLVDKMLKRPIGKRFDRGDVVEMTHVFEVRRAHLHRLE